MTHVLNGDVPATNVISTYLLGLLLLPKLRATAQTFNTTPHLCIVSSEVHAWAPFPEKNSPEIFPALNNKETANMQERYPVSKLLEVFITRELASLHTASENRPHIIINYVTPGLCHSDLTREAPRSMTWFLACLKFVFARTAEVGSRTLVHAANGGEETHGQYLNTCRVTA